MPRDPRAWLADIAAARRGGEAVRGTRMSVPWPRLEEPDSLTPDR